ncbi:MAG: type II toxin-antitoxin system VapC family toxin [Spirochaetaceae bacterium]|jgi:predicted nucleic acid-binding protein|nr:type II toxin-antitoxin system VapC family toxin [Spirochaetaceae bacterium]
MIAVVDVSGTMEILLQREKAVQFSALLQAATLVLAPELYISELTNTLWKYHRSHILTKDECIQYIHDGINYVDRFVDSKDLWQEAFSEGVHNNHSIYDMFYMVVARRNDGILMTNDSALASICKKNTIQVCDGDTV